MDWSKWKKLFSHISVEEIVPALLVLVVGLIVIKLLLKLLDTTLRRSNLEKTAYTLLRSFLKILLLVVLVLMLCSMLGVNVTRPINAPLSSMTGTKFWSDAAKSSALISVETGTGRLSRRWWISIMECSSVLRRSIWQRSFTAHNRSPSVSAPRYAPSREMMGMAE